MLKPITDFLTPPIFADEEKTRQARLLHFILLFTLLVATIATLVFILFIDGLRISTLVGITLTFALLGLLVLMRRDQIQAVGWLLTMALFLGVTVAALSAEGVRAPNIPAYFIVLIVAGLVLGQRAVLIFGGLAMLAIAGLYLAEVSGLMTFNHANPTMTLTVWAAVFFLTVGVATVLLRSATRSIAQGFSRARERAAQLDAANAELDAKVQARTAELQDANAQLQLELAERQRAEAALRESESRYRLIAENISDVIFTMDLNLRYTYISPSIERMTGYSVAEAMTQSLHEVLSPASVEVALRTYQESLERERLGLNQSFQFRVMELERLCKNGSNIWIETSITTVRDSTGRPYNLLGITRDITARKQAETSLRESEARFSRLVEAAFEAIVISDQGRIIDANAQATQMLGVKHAELIGMSILDFVAPEARDLVQSNISAGHEVAYEHLALRKDGSTFPVEVRARLLPHKGRMVRVTAIRDITERRRAADALQRYAERLEILHEIDRAILMAHSPEEIATAALHHIRKLVPCLRASVIHFDRQLLQPVVLAVSVNGETRLGMGQRLPPNGLDHLGVADLRHGKPMIVDDLLKLNQRSATDEQLLAEGVRARLIIPLLLQNELNGLLVLSAGEPGSFDMEHVGIMREVADQLAIAIQQAQLRAEMVEALKREQRLNEVAHIISSSLDPPTILQNIVRLAAELIGAETGTIGLLNPDGEAMTYLYVHNDPMGFQSRQRQKGQGVSWHVIASGQSLVVNDYPSHPDALRERVEAGAKSFLCSPIRAGEKVLGVLVLIHMTLERRFSERDVTLAESIGRQAGVAIQNAQLFAATHRQLAELTVLQAVALAGAESDNEDSLVERVTQIVSDSFFPDYCGVMLLDQAAGMLRVHPSHRGQGIGGETMRVVVPLGQNITGMVAIRGQPWRIPDVRLEPTYYVASPGMLSELCVPLKTSERVLGVINVESKQLEAFSEADERLLCAIADQLATAIARLRATAEIRKLNAELLSAYDATLEGWSRALDLRDRETEGHTQRVTDMTMRLAQTLGLRAEELTAIRRGALLHDIGKMGVPDSILLKPGPLAEDEWDIMRLHPTYAVEMLASIGYLSAALDVPYCHHEKWDGTGYPRGLKGEQIPLIARVFAVVDVWDALRSHRPYRAAWPEEQVRDYIRSRAGTHFDPRVVEAFLKILQDR